MRFKFCGDADCPDWLLVQINNLSKMTSIKMKVLSGLVVKSIIGEETDQGRISNITTEAKLDPKDSKGCIAALAFILSSATRFAVSEKSLNNELQQVGFPKEHASVLCRVFCDNVETMSSYFAENSLRLSKLESISCSVHEDSLKVVLKSWQANSNSIESNAFKTSKEQLGILLADLNQIYSRITNLGAENQIA